MFNLRKNKRFNYKSRFDKEETNTLKDELSSQWNEARSTTRSNSKSKTLPILIIVLVLLAILMYYLETKIN